VRGFLQFCAGSQASIAQNLGICGEEIHANAKAFSSEVDSGLREESALKRERLQRRIARTIDNDVVAHIEAANPFDARHRAATRRSLPFRNFFRESRHGACRRSAR
jgi:hypothetical protein